MLISGKLESVLPVTRDESYTPTPPLIDVHSIVWYEVLGLTSADIGVSLWENSSFARFTHDNDSWKLDYGPNHDPRDE